MNNKLFEQNKFANVPNAHTFMGSSKQGMIKGYGGCSDGKGVVHVGKQNGGGYEFKGGENGIANRIAYSGCNTGKGANIQIGGKKKRKNKRKKDKRTRSTKKRRNNKRGKKTRGKKTRGRKTRGRKTRGGMKNLSFSPLKSVPIKLAQSIDSGYGYTTGVENKLFYGSGYPEITPNTGCKKGGAKSRKGRRKNKRKNKRKTQKGGGYKQYFGGIPIAYSTQIPPNGPQNGQMAMPPPYKVLNNCQDNYNHYMQK
jgi:hypothetical protein